MKKGLQECLVKTRELGAANSCLTEFFFHR